MIDLFKQRLIENGGAFYSVSDMNELPEKVFKAVNNATIFHLEENQLWNGSDYLCSIAELNRLDTVMITGSIGVSENGTIWIDQSSVPHPIIPFIAQQLIIEIKRNQIVSTMEAAYELINFDEISYGVFIAGPSKTADIEQSLVIGAHGPKSLTVILTDLPAFTS